VKFGLVLHIHNTSANSIFFSISCPTRGALIHFILHLSGMPCHLLYNIGGKGLWPCVVSDSCLISAYMYSSLLFVLMFFQGDHGDHLWLELKVFPPIHIIWAIYYYFIIKKSKDFSDTITSRIVWWIKGKIGRAVQCCVAYHIRMQL